MVRQPNAVQDASIGQFELDGTLEHNLQKKECGLLSTFRPLARFRLWSVYAAHFVVPLAWVRPRASDS